MMRLSTITLASCLAALAGLASLSAGCGGARSERATTADTASEATDDDAPSLPLDPPALVPGTGVTLSAPRGSEPMPIGSGFVHRRRRLQILVNAAHGDAEVLQAFEESLAADAEERSREDVRVAGRAASLHVDRQELQEGVELERVWTIVREGERAILIAGAYEASRSERLLPLVRASVLSAEWDPEATLDPELAVGYGLTPPEPLALIRATTNAVSYGLDARGGPLGAPSLFLIPIPVAVPFAQRDEACTAILAQAGPIPDERVQTRGRIEGDDVEGCEVTGLQDGEGDAPRLATYAAIVYVGDAVVLVAGAIAEADAEGWTARFSQAALTAHRARP